MRRLGDGKGGSRRCQRLVPTVERCEDRQLLAAGLSSLSGFVYCDVNNDGVKQTSEPAVVGAKVVLGGTDSLGDLVSETTTTDSTGAYHFTSLAAGTYSLQETPPTGTAYIGGKVTQGTPGTGTTGTRLISSIVLAAGVDGQNNDFGEHLPTPSVVSDMMLVTSKGPSQIVVTFDETLGLTEATTASNYTVSVAVKTRKGVVYQPVGIAQVQLDASHQTVKLTLERRLNVFGTNLLTIDSQLNPCSFTTDFQGHVGVIPPGLGPVPTPTKAR